MEENEYFNNEIARVAKSLESINKSFFKIEENIEFADKQKIYKILHHYRSALFPNTYGKLPINNTKISILIDKKLKMVALELKNLINKVLINNDKDQSSNDFYKFKVDQMVMKVINKFPEIRNKLQGDIQAAYDGDPAAITMEEILLSYPSIEAISTHRISHELFILGIPIIPRIMSEYAHRLTGIDIHPGAKIEERFFIDHGTGVVVGETCTIGRNVRIYQGVTLGAKSFSVDHQGNIIKELKRHPTIEDNVVIYAGTTILGGKTVIGHDSVIGGNVCITSSVPPHSKVYNSQPAPIIKNTMKI
ncbi:serine O-acetyltransferase EpsC (plasmid) [Priestia megaterium]|uniref:serine O-acetyltransferase EpsC n=1 Tax=Priestia megaterium TaxID=1404 RepID=UPI0035BE433B